MAGPLSGLRILDLTWVLSGPYCTMTLGDLGADVIKCERPPYGDHARNTGPLIDGESGYFFSVNRGKRSIAIDLKTEEGRALFLRLVAEVDVVVENFTPGTMEALGLGYEALSAENGRLIYCAISGFGRTGPLSDRPALDVIVQGMGGIMSVTGQPGGPPARPGTSLGDIAAGLYAAVGILAALHERERSGRGQLVDISMLDCQVAIQENAFMRYHVTGETPQKLGTRHPTAVPFQAFETADGHVVVALAWRCRTSGRCSARSSACSRSPAIHGSPPGRPARSTTRSWSRCWRRPSAPAQRWTGSSAWSGTASPADRSTAFRRRRSWRSCGSARCSCRWSTTRWARCPSPGRR